ncbi:MFS transporter [Nibricoccus sp. IMCC34717]|uniref:MFS transporter n=1 Tax=Nibricoccus sp. IMCC34717 TaxID=3034021 RepID=UPI00384BB827
MLVTRLPRVSWPALFLAQLPFGLWMFYLQLGQATGSFTVKRFTDDPVYVTTLLMLLRVPDMIVGPIVSYWSDSIWTAWGRRTPFITAAAIIGGAAALIVPFMGTVYGVIAMLLVLQLMIAAGQTFQALSQELVPLSQRGRASGIRSLMFQLSLIVFFSLVIGRFDDDYRHGFIASLIPFNGEILTYWLGAGAMALPAVLIGLGVVELRSVKEKEVAEARAREQVNEPSDARLKHALAFPIRFVRNLCAKELIASYLTILVLSSNIEMMSFNYLLYTEQWGYSKQDMGGNIALGIAIMIPFTFLAGMLLDKLNAARALFWTMGMVFLANLSYILFVNVWMAGQRPTLLQILIFGEVTSCLKWVSMTICWALMFQFVPKNRMGAATAGTNIFAALCIIASSGFMGHWIEWYSAKFSPPAGAEVRVVLSVEKSEAEIRQLVGTEVVVRSIETGHRGGSTSSHWAITKPDASVGAALAEKKKLEVAASDKNRDPAGAPAAQARIREIDVTLEKIARDWEAQARERLAPVLAPATPDGGPPLTARTKGIDYNYFSGYFLVMMGGLIGMGIARIIVVLERRGFFREQKERVEAQLT